MVIAYPKEPLLKPRVLLAAWKAQWTGEGPLTLEMLEEPVAWATIVAAWRSRAAESFRESTNVYGFAGWLNAQYADERSPFRRLGRVYKAIGVAGNPADVRASTREIAAGRALLELVDSATRAGGRIFLDVQLLLRAIDDPSTGHLAIGSSAEVGLEVVLKKSQLRTAARALRPLPGVEVFYEVVDQQGHLCFRWRGGRGGLNLRSTLRTRDMHPDDLAVVSLPPAWTLPWREVVASVPTIAENKPGVARARKRAAKAA